jgi:hypothetical protein
MTIKTFFLTVLLVITTFAIAQTKQLIIPKNINLPKDTIVSNKLIKSLNGFLAQKENENKTNTFVLNEDLLETSILLDEMKEIEKSAQFRDYNFYKGYLTNVVQLDGVNFLIQFSYIGVTENLPALAASFEILAKQKDDIFYFLSPLKRNTSSWKTKKIGDFTFHYKNKINEKNTNDFVKNATLFDTKLNAKSGKMEWYGCDDLSDLIQTIGVKYKLDYNGRSSGTFSANENNTLLAVSGLGNTNFNSYDPHDLWHDRLHNVVSTKIINKPVDEGCAYLYGGSWGITWSQILKMFKEKVSSNPKSDWLSLYEQFYNFGESKEKHLIVGYVINALLVEKIEKEKGFPAVMELLSCGRYEKTNENYFVVLEKLTGINKLTFNESVWKLINESGK